MWGFINPMIPKFEEAKKVASHIPLEGERGSYTEEMFREDFPQFTLEAVPETMLAQFIEMANTSVQPSAWGSWWRYASGLFVAHFGALYMRTYNDGTSPVSVASGATQTGLISSATMGDTSISYDNSAIVAGSEKWGTWNATEYGAQLATLARMVGIGGMYVI
jgi:hypothetical protein